MSNLVNNFKNIVKGINKKRVFKIFITSILAVTIFGGGVSLAYKYYDNKQEQKARTAQTTILKNKAKEENVSIKSEEDIKNIVSSTIEIDKNSITFDEIYLSNGNDMHKFENKHQRREFNYPKQERTLGRDGVSTENTIENNDSNNKTTVSNYIYKVKAKANSLEYNLYIDATSGKILNTRIDD